MSLIEYCLTVALLAFIMVIGLNASMAFYRTIYLHSEQSVVLQMAETARNYSILQEQPQNLFLANLSYQAPSLIITGPQSLTFIYGELSSSSSYSLVSHLFHDDILITSDGTITE